MRRRNLIALIAGSVAAWPSVLSAQPAERIRVVGALMGQGNDPRSQANLAQLRDALRDLGWTDGHNLHLEVRWAAGEMDRSMSSVTRSCGSEPVLSPWILPFMRSSYWHLADMVIALSNVRFWA